MSTTAIVSRKGGGRGKKAGPPGATTVIVENAGKGKGKKAPIVEIIEPNSAGNSVAQIITGSRKGFSQAKGGRQHYARSKTAGRTEQGIAFIRARLDPCGEATPAGAVIPDGTATVSLGMQRSDEFTLGAHPDWTGNSYTLYIFSTPNYRHPTAFIRVKGTFDPNIVQNGRMFQALDIRADAIDKWRPIGTSLGFPADGDAHVWIGTCSSIPEDGVLVGFSRWRTVGRGLTVNFSIPGLGAPGVVTCGQFPHVESPTLMMGGNTASGAVTAGLLTLGYDVLPVPMSLSGIVQTDPRHTVSLASDGVYMPMLVQGDKQPWVDQADLRRRFHTRNLEDSENITSGTTLVAAADFVIIKASYLDPALGWGVIVAQGLDLKTTVTVKSHRHDEQVIRPGSSLAVAQRQCPSADMGAVMFAADISKYAHHAYPASYNARGFVGNFISSVLHLLPGGSWLNAIGDPLITRVDNWAQGLFRRSTSAHHGQAHTSTNRPAITEDGWTDL